MVLSDVPNGRTIAKCFLVDKSNLYTVNQRVCKISSNNTVSVLLFYILNRNKYFLDFDDGVKQTNLKKDDVLNCPLFFLHHYEQKSLVLFYHLLLNVQLPILDYYK
jgi:type I restriction enzyme S subunit